MMLLTSPQQKASFHFSEADFKTNPFKGKPRISFEDLDPLLRRRVDSEICSFCTYDGSNVESLKRFTIVSNQIECIFAKKANLWGSLDWLDNLSIHNNVSKIAPTFLKFTLVCQHLGLDGFVIELPGKYGSDIEVRYVIDLNS